MEATIPTFKQEYIRLRAEKQKDDGLEKKLCEEKEAKLNETFYPICLKELKELKLEITNKLEHEDDIMIFKNLQAIIEQLQLRLYKMHELVDDYNNKKVKWTPSFDGLSYVGSDAAIISHSSETTNCQYTDELYKKFPEYFQIIPFLVDFTIDFRRSGYKFNDVRLDDVFFDEDSVEDKFKELYPQFEDVDYDLTILENEIWSLAYKTDRTKLECDVSDGCTKGSFRQKVTLYAYVLVKDMEL